VSTKELSFVVPTYRLRDVGETIEQYDEHRAPCPTTAW
jgi:hypothetical protein